MKKTFNPRFTILLLFISAAAFMRIPNAAQLTPWANFTPIGAMGIFGGACFASRWKALVFPLLTLFISDLIINNLVFDGKFGVMYNGWYIIYGIFALIVFLGKWIIREVNIKNVLAASLAAAITHWMIADFAVWMAGGIDLRTITPLTKDWAGLLQCYSQGSPFMKNFLISNLVYGTVLFGGFELTQLKYPALKLRTAQNFD